MSLNGKSTILTASYFPAIDLSNGDYERNLSVWETYHTIPNVNESNNKFYFVKDGNYNSQGALRTKCEGINETRDFTKMSASRRAWNCCPSGDNNKNNNNDMMMIRVENIDPHASRKLQHDEILPGVQIWNDDLRNRWRTNAMWSTKI